MNLDRLLALIRLANNNPSENEANSAARRVCLELAKDNFALLKPSRTAADKLNQHANNYGFGSWDPFQDLQDMMRKAREQAAKESARTWNDVKRSEEPQFRSKPPKQEYYTKEGSARTTQETWKGGFRPSQAQEDFFRNAPRVDVRDESWVRWDERPDPGPGFKYDQNGKRVRESATRKCSKCGYEVSTFRTKEEPFVCNPCHWKEYP